MNPDQQKLVQFKPDTATAHAQRVAEGAGRGDRKTPFLGDESDQEPSQPKDGSLTSVDFA